MNSPKEANSWQLPESSGLPRPLLEEEYSEEEGKGGEKEKPGGGDDIAGSFKFPSASYFRGLLFFFTKII